MQKATYTQVCKWIVDAWEKIPRKMVQNSFKKSEIIQGNIDDAQSNLTSDLDCFLENDDNAADDFMSDTLNLSPELLKLFNSDTEDEDFDVFFDVY